MQSLKPKAPIFLLLIFFSISSAQNLSRSQSKTLFRLQRALEYPPAISHWNRYTNFCSLPPSPDLSIQCSFTQIVSLSIAGNRSTPLSSNFSADSLFTTLSRIPSLTSLSLVNLGIWGPLPGKVDRFRALQTLNLSSNHFHGALPLELSTMGSLQNLVLKGNSFNGTAPSLQALPFLTELDLGDNLLGPEFPSLGKNITTLVLRNNSFGGNIPKGLASFDQLQNVDLSSNKFVGQIPAFLFSLPLIRYLDLSENRLAGAIPGNLACGAELGFVDVSDNLLTGGLPECVGTNSSNRVVLSSGNCLSSGNLKYQHPNSYCTKEPLAAILPPANKKSGSKSNLGLILGIVGGIIGGVVVIGFLVLVVWKKGSPESLESIKLTKSAAGKASVHMAPRTPAETRHMSQAVRIGTLGLAPYRIFTLEELEEATNGFDPLNLISEGSRGQFYKGWLRDGSTAVVRCLKLKQKQSPKTLHQYMDVISKLRHRHLVSILGHCIITGEDNASTIFLVLEQVSNGTLRSHLTEWRKREMMKWPQRVSAVIGVARGIQFLHTVTVPGIVGNDLNIENILLDETLTAKISNYNLPVLSKNKNNKVGSESPFMAADDSELGSTYSLEHGEEEDVHQLGLILLEVITGKPAGTGIELDTLKVELQMSLTDGPSKLHQMTDAAIRGTFAYDSLKTAVEVALNCVAKDAKERPSIDDVLWNLQYSVQVQDGWASSENLSTISQ